MLRNNQAFRNAMAATSKANKTVTVKITDRMAEALTDTALTEDGQTVRLTSRVLAGTTCGLMDRGMVRYNRELTRENGYEVHTLTPYGHAVRERLLHDRARREFPKSMVRRETGDTVSQSE